MLQEKLMKKNQKRQHMRHFVKFFIFIFIVGLMFVSCTLSIILTDSHGTDNDVESIPSTEAKTDVDVSVKAIP